MGLREILFIIPDVLDTIITILKRLNTEALWGVFHGFAVRGSAEICTRSGREHPPDDAPPSHTGGRRALRPL